MANLQEMREQLTGKQAELKKISESVKERRSAGKTGKDLWTEDEQKTFDKLTADIAGLNENIRAEERAESLEKHLAEAAESRGQQTRFGRTDPKLTDPIPGNHAGAEYGEFFSDRDAARHFARTEEKRALAFHAWACEGRNSNLITEKHRQAITDLKLGSGTISHVGGNLDILGHNNQAVSGLRGIVAGHNTAENRSKAYQYLADYEKRAIGFDSNKDDWIPTQFRDAFEIAFHGAGGVMPICDMLITDSADQLPWPFADDYGNEGQQISDATTEVLAGVDAEMLIPTLGTYDFSSKFARISKTLLANSPFDLAAILGQVLGERIAKAMERQLTVGDRSSTFGGYIERGEQAATVPVAAVASLAKLQTLIWSVINEHRQMGTLVMHDQTLAAFAALVDGHDQPLLSIGNGRLQIAKDVSYPYRVSNYLPYADAGGPPLEIAAGEKPVAFGNFKQMKVRVVRAIRLERFNERFAEYHQAAFMANRSADADLLRGTAAANCPIKYLEGA